MSNKFALICEGLTVPGGFENYRFDYLKLPASSSDFEGFVQRCMDMDCRESELINQSQAESYAQYLGRPTGIRICKIKYDAENLSEEDAILTIAREISIGLVEAEIDDEISHSKGNSCELGRYL